ncbi:MAG: EVE domain-containing protein [Geminicoccaceae bacterium]|jgi:predicted RNA-binding protein with PUA-like domain|nr:EVE domain-containing protein [Geminicoccaceae bacterium]HRY23320.1 EVE domain-containing protein [Geminicoccaceae bacterium]
MAQWLMKTEPEDYSWDRLVAEGGTGWDGVRNHQAAANMRAMQKGDRAFFYRSLVDPAVIGIMEITRAAYADPDDPAGKWVRVDVAPVRPLPREVSLKAIKADPALADLALVRQSRLSVMPVSDAHWALITRMAGLDA